MVKLVITALFTLALIACGHGSVGPVDHSCPNNPGKASGSGCEVPP